MKTLGCESCILRCDIDTIQTNLQAKIEEADARRREAELGVEITEGITAGVILDVQIESISEAAGVRDDRATFVDKALSRIGLFEAAVDALRAHKELVTSEADIRVRSAGPGDVALAETLGNMMDDSCGGGPRQGFTVPLTGIVVPLPAGMGEQYCSSGAASGAMLFVERIAVQYPGVLPETPNTPTQQ